MCILDSSHILSTFLSEYVSAKGWSAEDNAQLLSLHEQHPGNFMLIGRTMGRVSSECRTRYITLTQKRVSTGRFTASEDYDLVAAVKKVRGLSKNTPLKNIPNKGKVLLYTIIFHSHGSTFRIFSMVIIKMFCTTLRILKIY